MLPTAMTVPPTGVFEVSRQVVPVMRRSGWGRIVNMASLAGKEGTPNLSAYSAAKAGVIAFTKSLAKELAETSIRVNSIAPAAIDTDILRQMAPEVVEAMVAKSPMRRLGTVDEVADLVLWIDGDTGALTAVATDIRGPNGLCFSPDETSLYLVEWRAVPNRLILAYDVVGGTSLANGRVLIDAGPGTPDGLRCDVDGNLWCGWGMGSDELDGVVVYNREGQLIGRIRLPERCANLCFGGLNRNRLFMDASHSIYALYVNTRGASDAAGA